MSALGQFLGSFLKNPSPRAFLKKLEVLLFLIKCLTLIKYNTDFLFIKELNDANVLITHSALH